MPVRFARPEGRRRVCGWFGWKKAIWWPRRRCCPNRKRRLRTVSRICRYSRKVNARDKQARLIDSLRGMTDVIVAYSGGTDSAYLAWAAVQALGERALAVTADSPSLPASHKKEAAEFAREIGIRHQFVQTREF